MSENENVVRTETLWCVAVRVEEDGPWVPFGSNNADPAPVLRTYDYRTENHPGEDYTVLKTTVTVTVEDPEELRKKLEQESVSGTGADVQSE